MVIFVGSQIATGKKKTPKCLILLSYFYTCSLRGLRSIYFQSCPPGDDTYVFHDKPFHSFICHLLQQEDRCKERLLLLELQVLLLEPLLGQQQDLEGMEERQQRRRGAGGS